MSNRRAMTMIELVVSLALLGVISIVSASWMTATLRTQNASTKDSRWDRSAYAVLASIERDLLMVDWLESSGRSRNPRVSTSSGQILIRTRENGLVRQIAYRSDDTFGVLYRMNNGDRIPRGEPPLLGELDRFTAEIEAAPESSQLSVLRVRLARSDGRSLERSYTLSMEDTQ